LEKVVFVWDLADGKLRHTLPVRKGNEGWVATELGFSSDSGTMWAGSACSLTPLNHKCVVQWWDLATGKELRSVQPDAPVPNLQDPTLPSRVRVSSDGKTAIALLRVWKGPEAANLVVWDIASGGVKGERSFPAEQRQWAWTEDGSAVALSTSDGLVVADGHEPSRTRFTMTGVAADAPIAFSPDGRLLAARKTESEVIVVEVASGAVVATVKTDKVDHLALTDYGRTLVATVDNSLKVFDVATGVERGRRLLPVQAGGLLLPDVKRAITALADGTGLVWDLGVFAVQPKSSGETTAKLWDALANKDAIEAHKAVLDLVDRPAEAIALIREKLNPTKPVDETTVRSLVAKLDDPEFAEREAATKALQALGVSAAPAMRSALKGELSAEQVDRIKRLLMALNSWVVPPGERLRELRAVAILERFGTAEARKKLDELAGGVPDARLTMEAAAAVARLKGRSK
jgi:hypothetical protein